MMGYHESLNDSLFSYQVQLETRFRKNHPLRKIKELIDFTFTYKEVEKTYGARGNVSIPPPMILQLMLLLAFYNVCSERELIAMVPERLDWLWFLGLTIESTVPGHSVLSKARRRWRADVFRQFFERIVIKCQEAGLIDGTKIFMGGRIIARRAKIVMDAGAKGIGEAALIPIAPALANAIHDAVGVRIKDLPIAREKIFWALQERAKKR
jgi:transposase